MEREVPKFLENILLGDYGEELKNKIIEGYKKERPVTLRVNTIKTNVEEIKSNLKKQNISFIEVTWYKEALILENVREEDIRKLDMYENGEIYLQSLSSMIPPLILSPRQNENILDMAAAPGGKTTEIAALTNNEAIITACEKNKIRAERLKYNIDKQAARVGIMKQDARRLDDFFSFDKILLDSPCSGSGTYSVFDKNFTEELIKRSSLLQEELLKKALKILRTNGEMIYSTCSILKTENEDILNKVLKNENAEIVKIDIKDFDGIKILPSKIDGTLCIAPSELYEGFFIAKIRKIN